MAQFQLPLLPYEKNALEPHISEKTLTFHYEKHHAGYLAKLNGLMESAPFDANSLEDVIVQSSKNEEYSAIFNNAAQVWNHSFYWESMSPKGGGQPTGVMLDLILQSFGSYDSFVKEFTNLGMGQFGSGWVWLVLRKDLLHVTKTPNAHSPIEQGIRPLLVCDVWEHAYYLEYQNRRADYLSVFLNHLVNWEKAQERFQNI
ncbi:MAG: superoxide dismutase [Alphaproteobacteria bacterium]|nr:superoxide dismutase [Alphaproteobacteria bacterium]